MIIGGYVVPVDGPPIDGGSVVITDGRITAVGRIPIPEGAEVVDATGLWVLPGFVEGHAHLGIGEE
ncbi:MAG: amidohydrolase, partial [Nonomuraea sp.]|nr:amidohydrolase [Nonomuraea sp.]